VHAVDGRCPISGAGTACGGPRNVSAGRLEGAFLRDDGSNASCAELWTFSHGAFAIHRVPAALLSAAGLNARDTNVTLVGCPGGDEPQHGYWDLVPEADAVRLRLTHTAGGPAPAERRAVLTQTCGDMEL